MGRQTDRYIKIRQIGRTDLNQVDKGGCPRYRRKNRLRSYLFLFVCFYHKKRHEYR